MLTGEGNPDHMEAGHIKGHQDRNPFKKLDQWTKLNVELNHIAQGYLQEIQNNPGGQQLQMNTEN